VPDEKQREKEESVLADHESSRLSKKTWHGVLGQRERPPARGNVSAYRCVGVSAFAKHHQLRRDLLVIIAVSKSSITSPDADTPIRRPADTLPLAAHFERNDITIICETVH
jgi:hypothetical protein